MFKSAFQSLVVLLFGASYVSSLVGYAVAVLVEMAAQADKLPGYGWHLVALGIAALGRVVQDHFQKTPSAPAAPAASSGPSVPPSA